MMTVVKRTLVLLLVMILPFTFIGCDKEKAPAEEVLPGDAVEERLGQEELDQIVANAALATAGLDTSRFSIDMLMKMDVAGGAQAVQMTLTTEGRGAIDNTNKELEMTMDMTADVSNEGRQDMSMGMYVVDEWMYMRMGLPDGEQWMKTRLADGMWEAQSQIDQQVELMRTATESNLLGTEKINGTECYVVQIVPDMEALTGLALQQQTPGMEGVDLGQLNLAGLFKESLVKNWIAKDTSLLMKSQVHMLMEMSSEDIGIAGADFGKMTMEIDIDTTLYDHNQAVTIELPEEALEAEEVSTSWNEPL